MTNKNCRNCKYGDTCATNYCDAVWERAYNIRDGKDCWEPKEVNPNYIPPASVKVKGNMHMENLKYCPLCGKDMNNNEIHLCGSTPTLIHNCISGIQIKIQANTEHEVARKWNTFVTVANK